MSVSLQKGGNVNLTKVAGGSLSEVVAACGWDARSTNGEPFDLDLSAFVVDDSDNVLSEAWFVFYGMDKVDGKLQSPDGTVLHHGDNLTGAGDGDDEQLTIKVNQLPALAEKIVFAVTIYQAEERKQTFGQVKNAFIRMVDPTTGTELGRYDLGEDYSLEKAVIFGELYRKDGDWKFKAVGQGYNDGLAGLCRDHGVGVR